MATTVRYRFRVRRRTTANWGSLNEVLLDSEIGLESDALRRSKIGTGVAGWNSLLFYTPGLFDLSGLADGYSLFWDASAGNWIVGQSSGSTAQDITFEPGSSTGLVATNVQDAIEELENDRLTAEAALQSEIDAKTSNIGGILIQGGSSDLIAALAVGFESKGIVPAGYTITGWELLVYPSGSLSLDILKGLSIGVSPTSITPSGNPTVSAATNASGDVTGWTSTALSQSNVVSAAITANSGIKQFWLLLKGTRT